MLNKKVEKLYSIIRKLIDHLIKTQKTNKQNTISRFKIGFSCAIDRFQCLI